MCTVLLPPDVISIAVKYIISYIIPYHIINVQYCLMCVRCCCENSCVYNAYWYGLFEAGCSAPFYTPSFLTFRSIEKIFDEIWCWGPTVNVIWGRDMLLGKRLPTSWTVRSSYYSGSKFFPLVHICPYWTRGPLSLLYGTMVPGLIPGYKATGATHFL
jgi:hypothetical protein